MVLSLLEILRTAGRAVGKRFRNPAPETPTISSLECFEFLIVFEIVTF